jgi:two-component system CheB/CheR fusion protein
MDNDKGLSDRLEAMQREIEGLRSQLEESREILRAIHEGEVDALVVSGPQGEQIFTLRSAELPYRILVENIREGAVNVLSDGTIHYANRAFADLVQNPLEKVIGSSLREYVAETDRGLLGTLLRRSLDGGARGELSLWIRGERLLPVYLTMSSLPLDDVKTICVVVTDLSEQKRSEQVLASERFARAILNQAADAIAVSDAQGRLTYVNPAARRLAGRDPSGITTDMGYEDWGKAFDFEGHPIPMEEWSLPRALRGETGTRECRMIRPDGSRYDISISANPMRGADGSIVGAVAVFKDITEQKAAEQALIAAKRSAEKAKAAAEEASRAKDRFMAVLSHELRTPLTPVLAAVSMLQKAPHRATPETLEVIRRNVELEARLIDDMLDLTRVAQGKVELHRHPVPLATIIHRAVEVCRPDIDARRLEFGLDIGIVPCVVDADAARLQQVFWNLLKNAIKFTPHGGCVGVRCELENDKYVVVEVSDSGVGIEPEALPRIFDAFAQADRRITRQFGGLGLGLAISRSLVELHGGSIEGRSPGQGKGATFRVRLPLLGEPPGPGQGTFHQEPQAEMRALRLLLVEDHGDTADLLELYLVSEGHTVERAGDVATALEKVERGEFDLLISDLGLPDGSGVDLLRELRNRGQRLPAIALSGYGQEEDIQQSRLAGFVAHVVKPVDIDRLTSVVASAVTRRPRA